MFPFMFAVLGSMTFWVIYGLVTIVMTMVCFRFCFPNCHTYFMEKETLELDSDGDWPKNDSYINNYSVFWAMLLCFVTWPLISIAIVLGCILYAVYMFFAKLILPAMAGLFRLVDRAIPTVKITKG